LQQLAADRSIRIRLPRIRQNQQAATGFPEGSLPAQRISRLRN